MKGSSIKDQYLEAIGPFSSSRAVPCGRKLTVKICRAKNTLKSDKSIQTDYRESEAQTVPWTPEFVYRQRGSGQLLAREWLALGENPPLNLEKIVLIERARQKQAWEDSVPRSVSRKKEFCRLSCVAAVAINETNFMENLIEVEHKERLRLSKENLKGSRDHMLSTLESRLEKRYQENSAANSQRVKYWNHQLRRRMRKLTVNTMNLRDKFKKDRLDRFIMKDLESLPNINRIDDIINMGEGNHEGAIRYLAEFRGIEMLEKQIAMPSSQEFQVSKKPKLRNFCLRIVRNAEKKIESLRSDKKGKELKIGVENHLPRVNLRRRIGDSYAGISGRKIKELDRLEKLYQSSLFLTKIVKGRAIQTKTIFGFSSIRNTQIRMKESHAKFRIAKLGQCSVLL